jgi:hypothetical protein
MPRKKNNCWVCCRDILSVAIELDIFEVEQDGGDEGEFQFDEFQFDEFQFDELLD